jgi:primosomal protein N'
MELKCPVCEFKIELPAKGQAGERITCTNCFAQMALYNHKGKLILGCALCKEPMFDPANCEECERRRERKKIIDGGEL